MSIIVIASTMIRDLEVMRVKTQAIVEMINLLTKQNTC